MNEIAKTLILGGLLLLTFGCVLLLLEKIPGAGRLPGDLLVRKENFTFYFPVTTSILLSLLFSLVMLLLNRK